MKRRWMPLFASLITCIPAIADPPMTALRVEVLTQKERPIERASVVVDFVEGRSIAKFGKKIRTHWETRTNQEGIAKLPPVPQGKVRIQVIAKGYQTFGEIFDVNEEEKTITIKLNPPQAQYSVHQ
ncbi:MAG: carboxypeptidase-like regulatory domain-containing protein [Bryobacteraceae bacterium]|nr:carboxypeptidase-like regulatory domain-containing protein [Bryobacteraceae bacterium]MDW8378105.1 carboxypeptidase-like regulatory domain-containing protein [Bryobacterales bacterium]